MKHRNIILGFLVDKWEQYNNLLYQNEIVKMLERLFSQPYEIEPYKAADVMDFKKLVDIYKNWNAMSSYLVYNEVKHGYRLKLTF